ncbi:hypothetical protein [Malonomonas rubra]|uniref:hypothetical protein n=1 Tax=Malonomonas rubra TaxID=57040 RepID=UPI001114E77F|nr:hypothetical protein [Malonomonas rubra]
MGSARALLSLECNQVEEINIAGFVNGAPTYKGITSKKISWKIVSTGLTTATQKVGNAKRESKYSANKNAVKVWETKNGRINKTIGDFGITLLKSTSRGADPKEFYFSAGGAPEKASVYNRPTIVMNLKNHTPTVCSELMSIEVKAATKYFDFSKFRSSHSGKDLPPKIIEKLGIIREVLSEQCEQLAAMRFAFYPLYDPRQKDLVYDGTMLKDSNWSIHDGVIATSYDSSRRFKLKARSPFSVVGIDFEGTCEQDPVLQLSPQYSGGFEREFGKKPEMSDFNFAAMHIAKAYKKECPDAKKIHFKIDPVPDEYYCKEGNDCYLVWDSEASLKKPINLFEYKDDSYYISDYNELLTTLYEGNFERLKDYTSYLKFFHNDFIEIYSDYCSNKIKDPVGRKIVPIETRYDENGFVESERQTGPSREIFIERKYASNFDSFYGQNKLWAIQRLMNIRLKSQNSSIGSYTSKISNFYASAINDYNQLVSQVSGHCSDNKISTTYENLYRFFHK